MNLDTVNKAIRELERLEPTYQTCQKLASLYIVRDHQMNNTASAVSAVIDDDSDFIKLAKSKPIGEVLAILSGHMDAVRVLYPQEYDAVIQSIVNL